MSAASLSVIVPNYNHARYIGAALRAMLSQSVPPKEIIVVDDGSTDNSMQILESLARTERTLRVVPNERNRGAIFSTNRGLGLATGDCVYFASADDRVLPGLFEKNLALLARHPNAALCCADFVVYFDADTPILRKFHRGTRPAYYAPAELAAIIRNEGTYIPGASTVVRRSALLELGGYPPGLEGHCDWFAYLALGFRHGICYVPEPLAAYRRGLPGNLSSQAKKWSIQRRQIEHLLSLLKSPAYRDVLPLFRSSGSLSFVPSILRALFGARREHGDLLSQLLIRRAAWASVRRMVVAAVPLSVWRLYTRVHGRAVPPALLRDDDLAAEQKVV